MNNILENVPQTGGEIWSEMMSPNVMVGEIKKIVDFEESGVEAYASKSDMDSLYLYCAFDDVVCEDSIASDANDVSDFILDIIDNFTELSVKEYTEIEDWLFDIQKEKKKEEDKELEFEDYEYDYYDRYYGRYNSGYYGNLYNNVVEPKAKEENLPGFLKIKMI